MMDDDEEASGEPTQKEMINHIRAGSTVHGAKGHHPSSSF